MANRAKSQVDRRVHNMMEDASLDERVERILPDDPETWIEDYLKGDDTAFESFHRRYFQKMVLFLRECVFQTSTADAEDLTIDLELKVATRVRTFDRTKATFRVWLYTLARNLKIDYGRSLCRQVAIVENNTSEPVDGERALPYEKALAWECLGKLSPEYRDVIILTMIEGFSSKQAAAILHSSEGRVEGMKRRALQQLRVLLQSSKVPYKVCLGRNGGAL